jgi:hypothetical protein
MSFPLSAVVAGCAEADINAAKLEAGPNGTVFFPAGSYEVSALLADIPGCQDWVFQKGARLVRSTSTANPIIEVAIGSHLRIVGGEFDGNRAANPNQQHGIISRDGSGLSMSGDFVVKNVSLVGIWGRDGIWDICNGKVIDTGYWGIYWAAVSYMPGGGRRTAPQISRVTIDRSREPKTANNGGGICISGGPVSVIDTSENARIQDCSIFMAKINNLIEYNNQYDAVAIEVNYCYQAILTGNRVAGGRIGVSTQTCPWVIQSFNQGNAIGDYMIEMVNCEFGSAVGNMATGAGAAISHYGISISGTLTKGLNITGNNCKMLFATPINIAPGAGGGGYPHAISGNN